MDWRNRSFTTAEDREHFEVFARRDGYIGRESLCETPHRTLLEACACAGIISTGSDLERYQEEIEIITFQGRIPNLLTAGATRVVSRNEIVRTITEQSKKIIPPKIRAYKALRHGDQESCPIRHANLLELAICEGIYIEDRGFMPCGLCTKKAIAVFTERLCTRHDQTLMIVDTFDQHIVTLPELEMGIELAQLKVQNQHRIAEPMRLAS